MSKLKDDVISKLDDCELLERSIDRVMAGTNGLRDNGGRTKLIIDIQGGDTYTIPIDEKTANKFAQVIMEEYNTKLKEIRKEIDEAFNKGMLLV